MARNENRTYKRTPVLQNYPDVTHIKGEDKGPLCKVQGAKKFAKPEEATCRSCKKRHKRG